MFKSAAPEGSSPTEEGAAEGGGNTECETHERRKEGVRNDGTLY